jgi:hypothetical protein
MALQYLVQGGDDVGVEADAPLATSLDDLGQPVSKSAAQNVEDAVEVEAENCLHLDVRSRPVDQEQPLILGHDQRTTVEERGAARAGNSPPPVLFLVRSSSWLPWCSLCSLCWSVFECSADSVRGC